MNEASEKIPFRIKYSTTFQPYSLWIDSSIALFASSRQSTRSLMLKELLMKQTWSNNVMESD